ncbi:MAG: helix-turn-helix domain-containing protein [Armatimonadetes bacterium]|nr:helix-turn-helix domain-containing protein [Armatimonadota bacterium]
MIRRCLEALREHWDDPAYGNVRQLLEDHEEAEYFALDLLASRFGVDEATLMRWQEAGEIPGRPAGRGWKVHRHELERFEIETLPRLLADL